MMESYLDDKNNSDLSGNISFQYEKQNEYYLNSVIKMTAIDSFERGVKGKYTRGKSLETM